MMPPRRSLRLLSLLAACLAAACADRAVAPDDAPAAGPQVGPTARGTSAVEGIRVMTPQFQVTLGERRWLPVVPVNAEGYPSLALLATPPAIRSANPRVVAVDDSGAVTGLARGTTTVYATLGAWVDSAVVTVGAP
jgi:hypothetical protein